MYLMIPKSQYLYMYFHFLTFRIILSRKEEGLLQCAIKNTIIYACLPNNSELTLVLKSHLINICDAHFTCLHSLPEVVIFALQLVVVVKVTSTYDPATVLPSDDLVHLGVVVAKPRR